MASKWRLVLLGVVGLIGGCNAPHVIVLDHGDEDARVIVLENYSPQVVLAARYQLGPGNEVDTFDVVAVPVGSRISLSMPIDVETQSQRVLLMHGDCSLFPTGQITIAGGPGNTLITVDPDQSVRVRDVDNLDPGEPAATIEACLDVAERIEFAP